MKSTKKPDVKAPRFRKSVEGTLNAEFIEILKENVSGSRILDANQIKNVIKTFNTLLWNAVIDNRDGVEIPSQMGLLFIGTCQRKAGKNVDFKATADHSKTIQHKNWESDQHLAKIFFTTYGSKYRFKNHELWAFLPTREFKRTVGRTYPENWKKYIQIDPKLKISAMFRDKPAMIADKKEDSLDGYNEFEF